MFTTAKPGNYPETALLRRWLERARATGSSHRHWSLVPEVGEGETGDRYPIAFGQEGQRGDVGSMPARGEYAAELRLDMVTAARYFQIGIWLFASIAPLNPPSVNTPPLWGTLKIYFFVELRSPSSEMEH
jgi:hypothetical protein